MAWFKVDDKLHDHRKARRAKKSAMGVWVLAGSWCADNLMDGFVPESILPRWGTRSDAKVLVDVELWDPAQRDGEDGWQFRNWHAFQPSKAEVESEREATKERVRKWREAKRNGVSNSVTPTVTNTVSNAAPSRPVPTRPDPVEKRATAIAVREGSEASAQTLVGEWVEHCNERPPGRVIGQVAKELKAMLDEGIDPARVRNGLIEWNNKGLHPSALASVVHEVANRKPRQGSRNQETSDIFERAAVRMGVIQGGQQ